jgi:hypothetical protein
MGLNRRLRKGVLETKSESRHLQLLSCHQSAPYSKPGTNTLDLNLNPLLELWLDGHKAMSGAEPGPGPAWALAPPWPRKIYQSPSLLNSFQIYWVQFGLSLNGPSFRVTSSSSENNFHVASCLAAIVRIYKKNWIMCNRIIYGFLEGVQ